MKTYIYPIFRTIVTAFLVISFAAPNLTTASAAGINQKQLAVNLTFDPLPSNLTNFDLKGFKVVDGVLTGYGTLAGLVNGEGVTFPFELPVNSLGGDCQVLSLDLGPLSINASGLVLSVTNLGFDIGILAGNFVGRCEPGLHGGASR